MTYTVHKFFEQFPDNDSCLEHLMKTRYGTSLDCPHCGKHSKFSKHSKRPVYQCQWCSHQISPMAGTPFAKSRTDLTKWFYAMYLFTTTRHGVSAKELQRQLGVTYKCAWRMGHEIRKYMSNVDGDDGLSGHVEVDETYIGGRTTIKGRMTRASVIKNKTVVFGMVERGGDVMTRVIDKATKASLLPPIMRYIETGSTISSDELPAYKITGRLGFTHGYVTHGS
ncbi:MAG: IS1595 family transposase, partial [Gammaproteobacteria bacterium]|nr:IS1595 family transposase [Gammaproteobacteria bacterium]